METVGERIKRLRLAADLSQRELQTDGVSYAYISRIEAGTRQPSVKAIRKLAEKLVVPAEYLETGEWPANGMYLLQRSGSDGQTYPWALFPAQDEIEADEWAKLLTAAENGGTIPEGPTADAIWHVEFVSFMDDGYGADIAEQHASEPVEWTIKAREGATA